MRRTIRCPRLSRSTSPPNVVPYGATVRFEIDVSSNDLILPLDAVISTPSGGGSFEMYPSGSGNTFTAEVRLPWGIMPQGELQGPATPLRFPLSSPPAGDYTFQVMENGELGAPTSPTFSNWPHFVGGQYTFRTTLWSLAAGAQGQTPPSYETTFTVGDAPASGGAPPRIVHLESGLSGGSALIGQPWLAQATVEDRDNDVVAVLFTVQRGSVARWELLYDDGRYGDKAPRDHIYSHLRVGGDGWDWGARGGTTDEPVTLSAQAVDLRGNWSDPVLLQYQLIYSQFPLWTAEPAPNGPNIVEVGVGRAEGAPDYPRIWARCDSPDAWVCGRLHSRPMDQAGALYDDGKGPDAVAGNRIHSTFVWFEPALWPDPETKWDVVFYAVPKSGPPTIGQRMGLTIPPVA